MNIFPQKIERNIIHFYERMKTYFFVKYSELLIALKR